jgi:LL-diaminopimelate aminotransferase
MREYANKITDLPPYLFAQISKTVHELQQKGIDIIELTKSDPDHPTPPEIVAALVGAAQDPANHHYADFDGLPAFRAAIANWYQYRYRVTLDTEKEILPLPGSKDGLVSICHAFLNPGDVALIPDPGFPAYRTGALLAGAIPHSMPLLPQNHFLPDFSTIPADILAKAKLMFLNYPNNPTGAIAPPAFFRQAVDFAHKHNIIVCHDNAYSETTFDNYRAPSFLETPGAKEVGVEFFTFSKTFNMAGWRLAFVTGNAHYVQGVKLIETHINAGIFYPLQYAGAVALNQVARQGFFTEANYYYDQRRWYVVDFLNTLGWNLTRPPGTVYVWVPVPTGFTATSFTDMLLQEARVAVSPGTGFGPNGEGYIRLCLTYPEDKIKQAMERIASVMQKQKLQPALTLA